MDLQLALAASLALVWIGGALCGITILLGYAIYRARKAPGWDNSNVFNWLRLFAHSWLHPGDFVKMYYLTPTELRALKDATGYSQRSPFWYLADDEFSEVTRTRPWQ